ncbi:hypothetical protein LguiA_024237 [Lonicera macranthoides]
MAAAAALGSGFTWAQWKELERQAMIFKYMVASLPVPPHLLLPLTPNLFAPDISANPHSPFIGGSSSSSLSSSSMFNLRFSKDKDPEPGRCKRTDGKKWRCSRDVAPHQKYCERHMNRGRPRSRKPVESQIQPSSPNYNKKTRLPHKYNTPLPPPPNIPNPTLLQPNLLSSPNQTPSALLGNPKTIPPAYKEPNRGLDWMMEREMLTNEQQWQHFMPSSRTLGSIYNTSSSVFQPSFEEEPLQNLLSYTDFGGTSSDVQRNGECNFFMNQDLVSLVTPRGFIDAWSNDKPYADNESSVTSHGNLSPSSLNLSMAMAVGNALDEEMGLGDGDTGHPNPTQASRWSSPVSWVGSTAGGPLGEVLRPSTVAVGSNPASPYGGSPPTTAVSSPSGVLHRNVLSLSDSSVCNSPTFAASTATPETVFFQWVG